MFSVSHRNPIRLSLNSVTLLVLLTVCISDVQAEITGPELIQIHQNSTVFVAVKYKTSQGTLECETGTGVVISASGYVISSHHLIKDSNNARYLQYTIIGSVGEPFDCETPIGDIRELELIETLNDQDAMLLKFRSAKTYEYVRVCRETIVEDGEELSVLGFPLGQPLSLSPAILGNDDGPFGLWQITGAINPGNSGGPVFNKNGRLIGLVYGEIEGANDLSYMVPQNHFAQLISTALVPLENCETPSGIPIEERCAPIFVAYPVSWTKDDHSGASSSTQLYQSTFAAQSGHYVTSFDWIPSSVNNAAGQRIDMDDERSTITISTRLTSGPFFDRWRGWFNGSLSTVQIPVGCEANR